MSADTVIKTLLDAAAGITALVGTRVYADHRPEGDALPALVFSVISETPDTPFNAVAGPEPVTGPVQVAAQAATRARGRGLIPQAGLACPKQSGRFCRVGTSCVVESTTGPDSYDPLVDTYQQTIDFVVNYTR